jgi:type I restriction enzyme S subunit
MTELPQGWARSKGEQLFELIRGVTYNKSDVKYAPEAGFVGILRATNIQQGAADRLDLVFAPTANVSEKQMLREGDLLIATSSGSKSVVGKVAEIGTGLEAYSFGAFCSVARPYNSDFSKWVSYFSKARAYRNYVETVALGTNINNFRSSDIAKVEIPLPPIREQRRIVRMLDTLTARTTTAHTHLTAIEKLVERYKLSLLRTAFSGKLTTNFREANDLEPVSELLLRTPQPQQGRGGRQPTTDVTEGRGGISVNVPDVELPEAWEWVSLLRIARQETGHTPSRSRDDWWGGDVCWMSIPDANIHHGKVIQDTIQKTNDEGLANSSARLLPAGTVVLSRTASVGYICILGREMATSQDFATWTCSEALEPEYLMYALLSEGEDIKKFGEGSTHTTIYFPEIRAFNIKLAPLEEQREIVRRIKTAFAKIDRLAAEAAKALKLVGHLDQRILAKAFAGELVPQDPSDEPAETLIARIQEARDAAPKAKRKRRTSA